jgi:hypothetical protein
VQGHTYLARIRFGYALIGYASPTTTETLEIEACSWEASQRIIMELFSLGHISALF